MRLDTRAKVEHRQLRQQEPEAERGNRSARYFVNLIDGGTRQPAMKLIDHSCYSQPPGCRSAEDTSQRQRSGQVVAPYTLQAQGRNQRSECYQESGVTDGQQERRREVPF
jgi:preprotein translocase subunit SecA